MDHPEPPKALVALHRFNLRIGRQPCNNGINGTVRGNVETDAVDAEGGEGGLPTLSQAVRLR
jgi:hypothetical protein